MDHNIVFRPIPLELLKEMMRQVVQEEIAKSKGNDNSAELQKPITTKQLCDHLGITEPTVIRWRKKGKIPFFTIGSAVRFNLAKVLETLDKKKK